MDQDIETVDESECCGSGCNPCILDVRNKLKSVAEDVSVALDPLQFVPFLIMEKVVAGRSTWMYRFQALLMTDCPKNKPMLRALKRDEDYSILNMRLGLTMCDYLILKGQYCPDNGTIENVSRAFTPVFDKSEHDRGVFHVFIRLYTSGKMAHFLNTLQVGDVVFWRGPYSDFKYQTNMYSDVVLIGGGTGVVPLYNIAKRIVEDETEETRVTCLACFRTDQDIVLRGQLHTLKAYWNFRSCIYFSAQGDVEYTCNYGENIVNHRIDSSIVSAELARTDKQRVLVVICGSEGFNSVIRSMVEECGIVNENMFVF